MKKKDYEERIGKAVEMLELIPEEAVHYEQGDGGSFNGYVTYDRTLVDAIVAFETYHEPDYNYLENMREEISEKDPLLFDFDELRTYLTWLNRGERFNSGLIQSHISKGRLIPALKRSLDFS